MNKNYIRGKAKEHRLKQKYLKEGWDIVLRSAGSKGFADLTAIKKSPFRIEFIQAKPNKFNKKEKERLEKQHDWLNDEALVTFVVK